MTLPSTQEVFEISTLEGFTALLDSAELGEATGQWWIAAIDACGSRLTMAAEGVGDAQPIEWAREMVSVLDAASGNGALNRFEILRRRVSVQLRALEAGYGDFGDAGAICSGALGRLVDLGEDPRLVAQEIQELASGAVLPKARMADLSAMRSMVRTLAAIRDQVPEGTDRADVDRWMAAFALN